MRGPRILGWLAVACVVELAWGSRARAQTEVVAGDYGNVTWTEAGSPYRVLDSVSFEQLSVEAGSQVIVASAASPADRVLINVADLTIAGEQNRPVVFEGEVAEENGSWFGVFAADATVTHAQMRHATLTLVMTRGTVSESLFEDTNTGVEVRSSVTIDRCVFRNTGIGIFAYNSQALVVTNSLFVQSRLDGIACNGGPCLVTSSTFDDNLYAIYVGGGPLTVRNSIFSNNQWALEPSDAGTVTHSNLWQNLRDIDPLVMMGDGNLSVDPDYVGASDFHLSANSLLIDAGGLLDAPDHDLDGVPRPLDGDGVPDDDGSEFDMGAYEYDPRGLDGAAGQPASTGSAGAAGENGVPVTDGMGGSVSTAGAETTGAATTGGDPVQSSTTSAMGGATFGNTASMSGTTGTAEPVQGTGAAGLSSATGGAAAGAEPTAPARLSKGCGCRLAARLPLPESTWPLCLTLLVACWRRHEAQHWAQWPRIGPSSRRSGGGR